MVTEPGDWVMFRLTVEPGKIFPYKNMKIPVPPRNPYFYCLFAIRLIFCTFMRFQ